MITVPLRDLRNNFSKLEKYLAEGESIQIQKRGELIALLVGITKSKNPFRAKPNFAARRKAIWKNRIFTPQEVVSLREDELGEED
jgi:antitoxin (DNA-binding transcriptional repressor) of toxin-antitoxin stability system